MSDKRLGIAQRATLLVLMAEGRSLTNKEITAIGGFAALTGQKLAPLSGLIHTDKLPSGHVHTLTKAGWAWCRKELLEPPSKGSGTAGGALYSVLGGLSRYLAKTPGLKLEHIFQPASGAEAEPLIGPMTQGDIEAMIRQIYVELRTEPRGWISLTDLRAKLNGVAKDEVDAALYQMHRRKEINVVPASNKKILTPADREATIRIGNEDRLHLSIDEP